MKRTVDEAWVYIAHNEWLTSDQIFDLFYEITGFYSSPAKVKFRPNYFTQRWQEILELYAPLNERPLTKIERLERTENFRSHLVRSDSKVHYFAGSQYVEDNRSHSSDMKERLLQKWSSKGVTVSDVEKHLASPMPHSPTGKGMKFHRDLLKEMIARHNAHIESAKQSPKLKKHQSAEDPSISKEQPVCFLLIDTLQNLICQEKRNASQAWIWEQVQEKVNAHKSFNPESNLTLGKTTFNVLLSKKNKWKRGVYPIAQYPRQFHNDCVHAIGFMRSL